jgi:uncharacterized protein (TIGR00251 family)
VTTVRVHVIPNAKRDEIVGEHDNAIKIRLRAPAVEGKANSALCRFLAERLQIHRRDVTIERGEKSRDKWIRVDGLDEREIRMRLLAGTG